MLGKFGNISTLFGKWQHRCGLSLSVLLLLQLSRQYVTTARPTTTFNKEKHRQIIQYPLSANLPNTQQELL